MPRLIILGSGTPVPLPERWGTSFLLEIGDEWLMIDCGPASTCKMYSMGIPCTEIGHLFFTHYHSDHFSDYPCFLMTRFDMSIGEGIIAFSGDAEPTKTVVELGRNADMFVIYALNGVTSAAEMAKEAGAKRLTLAHQPYSLSSPDLINEAIEKVKSLYHGSVHWGEDMMEVSW